MNNEDKKILRDAVESYGLRLAENTEDTYVLTMYADYRDEFGRDSLTKISDSDSPRDTFYDLLSDAYTDYEADEKMRCIDEIMDMPEVKEVIDRTDEYDVSDYLQDIIYTDVPFDHYFDQDMCINIVVDTGDMNYDFACNSIPPSWAGYMDGTNKILDESSLLWLAKQHGIKKSEFKHMLFNNKCEGPFMQSVYDELLNSTSHINELVFCVKMSVRQFCDLRDAMKVEADLNKSYYPKERKGRGHIILTKDSTCGLIDEWKGSGSLLEIALEKDIRLPIRYIARAEYDGAVRYGIKEIYGVNDSLWSGAVKEIKPMKRRKGGFNE